MKKQNDAAKRRLPKKAAPNPAKVVIRKIPSGVKGLNDILGGGIPEFSFNIIAGTPGCGKTTLAHQIVFANATAKKPALYFTVLGEPAMKMLRYQQQYSFFDASKLGTAIRFINLADVVMEENLDAVFDAISTQVAAMSPSIVVVDSFRTVVRKAISGASEFEMQAFIQRLAQFLTGWEATTFLVGEYVHEEIRDNPVFTVADGLLWLSQVAERNSVVRKLQIMKLRGQESVPGCTRSASAHRACRRSRAPWVSSERRCCPRAGGGFPSACRSWTRCSAADCSKATASSSPDLRARGNPHWRRNSSPRDCAAASLASWRFSRNARTATPSAPRASG